MKIGHINFAYDNLYSFVHVEPRPRAIISNRHGILHSITKHNAEPKAKFTNDLQSPLVVNIKL